MIKFKSIAVLFCLGMFALSSIADAQCTGANCKVRQRAGLFGLRSVKVTRAQTYQSVPVQSESQSVEVFRVAPFVPVESEVVESVASDVSTLGIVENIAFRRSLMEAARQARKKGDLSLGEYLLLAGASRNPATLNRIQEATHDAAVAEGLATVTAIDWDGLISFIERLLPIILKLIELFGKTVSLDVSHMHFASCGESLFLAA